MADENVKGEGDYKSARRFQKDEAKFVKEHTKGGKEIRGSAKDATRKPTAAEREGRSHAKSGGQDKRDADVMRELGRKGKKGA